MHGSESTVVLHLWHKDSGQLVTSVKKEIKAFTFAHFPQRNRSFQMYMSLSCSDVSHKALIELCIITYGGVKFYEMTEAARRLSVLLSAIPRESFTNRSLFCNTTGSSAKKAG